MILLFKLTMPNVGSWNGRWTGEKNQYLKFRTISNADGNKLLDGEVTKNFYYNFGDGWGANVNIRPVMSNEKKSLERKSIGFAGYDWMIDSIIKAGKILNSSQIKQWENEDIVNK